MSNYSLSFAIVISLVSAGIAVGAHANTVSVAEYVSIQEALDQNPGRVVYVPSGDYEISEAIRIRSDWSGVFGPGQIIQTDPDKAIILVDNADNVQVRDLTLMRPDEQGSSNETAVLVLGGYNVTLENLQVLNNRYRGDAGSIGLQDSVNSQVRNCLVENYVTIAVDDRTANPDWGYAFKVINGTGIAAGNSRGTIIQGNRIVECVHLPTRELQESHGLGQFTKRNAEKGEIMPQSVWDAQYSIGWQQGAAIVVSGHCDYTQILGNYIENAAQSMDIHSDHVIISGNVVNNAGSGVKAMHGARHVLILGNQFSKTDLFGLYLLSGVASHPAGYREGDGEPMEANVDAGHVVASNIISDFGYGNAGWIWQEAGRYAIRMDNGQKPMNPPLRDVLVSGNLVYDSGRDGVLIAGEAKTEPPRYIYAVHISEGQDSELGRIPGPADIHFGDNLFHPGTEGGVNVELTP